MKIALLVFGIVAIALAEPPAPSSQYLPSNQYSAPRPFASAPSNQYGAPAQTAAFIKPNNQYASPSAPNSQYGAPRPGNNYLPPNQGGYASGSGGYDDQSEPANYNFEYHVQDGPSGNDFGHQESRQGDVAQGKYFVLLPDGRRQVVEYVADTEGYKPKISYEQVNNGIGGGYQNGGYQNGGYAGAGGNGNANGGYQY